MCCYAILGWSNDTAEGERDSTLLPEWRVILCALARRHRMVPPALHLSRHDEQRAAPHRKCYGFSLARVGNQRCELRSEARLHSDLEITRRTDRDRGDHRRTAVQPLVIGVPPDAVVRVAVPVGQARVKWDASAPHHSIPQPSHRLWALCSIKWHRSHKTPRVLQVCPLLAKIACQAALLSSAWPSLCPVWSS